MRGSVMLLRWSEAEGGGKSGWRVLGDVNRNSWGCNIEMGADNTGNTKLHTFDLDGAEERKRGEKDVAAARRSSPAKLLTRRLPGLYVKADGLLSFPGP